MIRRILMPTDGSRCSEQAIEQGLELAKSLGAEVTFLFAVEDPMTTVHAMPEMMSYHQELLEDLKVTGSEILARMKQLAEEAGVSATTTMVDRIRPAEAIHQAEQDHDLVVMGTHGRRGFNRFMFGSVAEMALRRSGIPYMMIRSPREAADS